MRGSRRSDDRCGIAKDSACDYPSMPSLLIPCCRLVPHLAFPVPRVASRPFTKLRADAGKSVVCNQKFNAKV